MSSKNAYIEFTPVAWTKMWLLVDQFESEVGWHGLCSRISDNKYKIEDIIVHKQTVTGGTFRTVPEEYEEWLDAYAENDPETFFKISLHGHSHYHAGASPSGLDKELQDDITSQLAGDMFYIFMIVNRRHNCQQPDMWVKIVDHKTGETYEPNQIYWSVADDTFDSVLFHMEAEKLVSAVPYQKMKIKKEDK